MGIHARREDRMLLRGWEKRRKIGSRWGTRKRKETRLMCREQGRKTDCNCDWSTEFPLDSSHVSRSVCQCLHVVLHFYQQTVAFVVGTEITATVVISWIAREEWKSEYRYIKAVWEASTVEKWRTWREAQALIDWCSGILSLIIHLYDRRHSASSVLFYILFYFNKILHIILLFN